MSRFESSRPSHAVPYFRDFPQSGRKAHVLRAFAGPEIRDRRRRVCVGAFLASGLQCAFSNLRNDSIYRARDRFAFLGDRFAARPIPEGMQLKGNGFAKDGELRQSEPAT